MQRPNHNLPSRLTSFVGREREITEVIALLRSERLVTLVGAPGVGKTRLSLQIAGHALDDFDDGVWLVELAPLADPALVPRAVATVLGLREQPNRPLIATLTSYLRTRRLLLILDNCEHLIEAAAVLAETLLQSCPRLQMLATSREPLTIEGEVVRRVPSLAVPDLGGAASGSTAIVPPPTVAEADAVRLFVERARAVSPAFTLSARTYQLVAEICSRLDGIPLAIELAAAGVRALSLEQIAARLDDRFRLLTGGSRTALPRQQTLRGAVDWSYDLLTQPEQVLLRRLAIFAGGFTLDAAEQVGGEAVIGCDSRFADRLISLVDKSLVQTDADEDGERRYRLLETFRQYGLEKLIAHGELGAVRDRHRDYFLELAETTAADLTTSREHDAVARLDDELDNLRAALAWSLKHANEEGGNPSSTASGVDAMIRMTAALWRFWWMRGLFSEGGYWVELSLRAPVADRTAERDARRASLLLGAAQIVSHQSDYRAAVVYMDEALQICRQAGDRRGEAFALGRLGYYHTHLDDLERGARLCEEGVALARELGDPWTMAALLHAASIVAWFLDDLEHGAAFADEGLTLFRKVGFTSGVAFSLRHVARCVGDLGEPARAITLANEALRISMELGEKRSIGESYKDLAHFAVLQRDVGRAFVMFRASIPTLAEIGDRWLIAMCLHDLARALVLQGTIERLRAAARIFGAAERLRELVGIALPRPFRAAYTRDLAILDERLGKQVCAEVWAEGRAMPLDEAAEYALTITAPGESATAHVVPRRVEPDDVEVVRITRRECEVAVLVARGLSNREIAGALVVSERTVETHVRNILAKLELSSRTQVVAWVLEHGLGAAPGR